MEKKLIIIITTGWFPEGDAGAFRLSMIGRALVETGHDVTVLCRGKLNDSGCSFGLNFISLRNIPGGIILKAIDYMLFPVKTKKYLNNKQHKLYAVYIYNAHISLFRYCKKFCQRNNIKLFHDCVEWYSPEEYRKGEKSHAYKVKNEINTEVIDNQFNVIEITRYLESYFRSKGINTLRVPVLCDSSSRTKLKELRKTDRLVVFYGGLPITKDLVGNLLRAAMLLSKEEQAKLRIILVGPTRDYLINISHLPAEVVDGCGDMLTLCGKVPRTTVLGMMEEADFAFLARDAELRYAKAGFPTKVVEALSNATPMLCNITSDLDEYLVDGKNSIIAASHSPEDFKIAIQRAMMLSSDEKRKMSEAALQTARECFDYRSYKEKIADFFK